MGEISKIFQCSFTHFVFSKQKNEIFVINKLRKYGIFQMQELEKKHIKKFQKKYCRRQSSETSLNGVTHLSVFGTVPETLKWAFCFFIFFVIKKFFIRNISVNINFDVA